MIEKMKLLLLIISLALLFTGWIGKDQQIALAGALVFISSMIVDTFDVYRMAKLYRNGNDVEELNGGQNKIKKAGNFLNGFITLAGLGTFAFGASGDDTEVYLNTGCIIWVGAIFFYALHGIIVQHVAGIRLRMGYGGWYVPRNARRKRSTQTPLPIYPRTTTSSQLTTFVIGNRFSLVYHKPWCIWAKRISSGNRIDFSVEEATKQGYSRCKVCRP